MVTKSNFKQLNMRYSWKSLEQNWKRNSLITTPRLAPLPLQAKSGSASVTLLHRQSEHDLSIIIGLNKLFKNCLLGNNFQRTVLRRVKLALMSQHKGRIWLRIAEIAACMRFKNEFHCLVDTADQNLPRAGLLLSYCSPQFQSTLGITSGEHYMTYTKELESYTEKRNRARLYLSLVSWCGPDQEKSIIQLKL